MTRACYGVRATPCGAWWAVEVPGVPGALTTAHSAEGVEDSARELLAGLLGVSRHSFDLELTFSEAVVPSPRPPQENDHVH